MRVFAALTKLEAPRTRSPLRKTAVCAEKNSLKLHTVLACPHAQVESQQHLVAVVMQSGKLSLSDKQAVYLALIHVHLVIFLGTRSTGRKGVHSFLAARVPAGHQQPLCELVFKIPSCKDGRVRTVPVCSPNRTPSVAVLNYRNWPICTHGPFGSALRPHSGHLWGAHQPSAAAE